MMRHSKDYEFKIVKAIVESCESQKELNRAIQLLEEENSRAHVLNTLRAMLTNVQASNSASLVRKTVQRKAQSTFGTPSTLSKLVAELKERGVSAPQIHDLIYRKFQEDIPVHKEGLGRYLRRVSAKSFFQKLLPYLLESTQPTDAGISQKAGKKPVGDLWVEQMISEHKKKSHGKEE